MVLRNTLENPKFDYWLSLFAQIMPHVEILFSQMQSTQINYMFARNCVTHFENEIQKIRNKIGVVEQQSNSSGLAVEPSATPKRT